MVQDLLERIMRVLGTEDQFFLSDEYLFALINEAQKKLAIYSQRPLTEELDLFPGEQEASLPPNCQRVLTAYWGPVAATNDERIELKPATGFPPLDEEFEEELDEVGEGDPEWYYLKPGRILVSPSPSVESKLYLVFNGRPQVIDDPIDRLEYEDSEDFIFNYVVHQFYVDRDETVSAREWKARMNESFADWIYGTENQNFTQPLVIKAMW